MEELHLGQEAPAYRYLVDIGSPLWLGHVAKVSVEAEVCAFRAETRRSVKPRLRIPEFPLAKKQMMEPDWRDNATHGSQSVHFLLERGRRCDRRPDEQSAFRKSDLCFSIHAFTMPTRTIQVLMKVTPHTEKGLR